MKKKCILALLYLFLSAPAFADTDWPSPATFIINAGAHKIEPGNGATFHTRIETLSSQDISAYENIVAQGGRSKGAETTCDLFYQEALRSTTPSVSVSLLYARFSHGKIGCVIKYKSSSATGTQIFFLEKVRSDIYQLALRD